jgi:hypothetical protein
MYVHPIEQLQATPSLGALVGTITSAPIIEAFNQRWGSTQGVIFGQASDPYRDNYQNLNVLLQNVIIPTQQQVIELETEIVSPSLKPILCAGDLAEVSDAMKEPILLFKPVRELFEADRIHGFGYNKAYLPKEDVYGRLIDNGTSEYVRGEDIPEVVAEHWSIDPDLSEADLDAIHETRLFLQRWIDEQMGPDGDMLDPTDIENQIKK